MYRRKAYGAGRSKPEAVNKAVFNSQSGIILGPWEMSESAVYSKQNPERTTSQLLFFWNEEDQNAGGRWQVGIGLHN